MFPVRIEDIESVHLGGIKHQGAYTSISTAFVQVGQIAGEHSLWPNVQGMAGVYFDNPDKVAEDKLQSFAGLILRESGTALPTPLEALTLEGGRHAIMQVKGPYDQFKTAYGYFYGAWLHKAGVQPRQAAPFEIYLNNPQETPPDELLTDIYMPLT